MDDLFELFKDYTKAYAKILVQQEKIENQLKSNLAEMEKLQQEKRDLAERLKNES